MYLAITIRSIFLIIGFCVFTVSTEAQQTAEKYVRETNYLLALPEGYQQDTSQKWPLLVFLHGSGESGSDLEKVKVHGPPRLIAQGKKFPFIVASPQAPSAQEGWDAEQLYGMIRDIKKKLRVDERRVYLTGLSMGGHGTWRLAIKHPEEFAAIAPICGRGDTAEAWRLRYMPIWVFHGAKDDVVLPMESDNMVKAARRYNPTVKYTLYPDADHNSWDPTYSNDSLYTWLLAQTRFEYKEIPATAALLKQYTGKYVRGKDTLALVVQHDTLVLKIQNESIPLKYAGDHTFFIEPTLQVEIRFILQKGIARSFEVLGERRELYKKVAAK